MDLAWEYSLSNVDTAEYYAKEGIRLAQSRSNERDLASSREMLAIVYDIRGSIEQAVKLFLEVATYYEDQKSYGDLSSTYNNIGTLFFNNNDIDKADEYFVKSMEIDVLRGDSLGVASSMINLASIANRRGDYESAYLYLLRGKRIIGRKPDLWTKRAIYEALGSNHLYKENYDSGAWYFEALLPMSRKSGDKNSELSCTIGLVMSYMGKEDFSQAEKYFQEAEKISVEYADAYQKRNLKGVGSDLFARIGNYEKAYQYLQLHAVAMDSITSNERIDKINELELKYQSEQREKEIAELEIENQKAENQRNILILASGFVILAAVFLIVLLKARTKSNQVIAKSLGEKETLLKEIHHRVKNNLQVISSLLSLQSRYIEDEVAQEAVNEGQNRVKSMALIHQKLYQNDNLMGVEVLDYVQNLTSALRSTYGITSEKVEVNYDVEALNIDVDTIIPIGLILNELISNSFKHAFPDERTGSLIIGLKQKEKTLELTVKDDGVGTTKDVEKSDSFGMRMIRSLAMKLEAEVSYDFSSGSSAVLSITNYKLV